MWEFIQVSELGRGDRMENLLDRRPGLAEAGQSPVSSRNGGRS